MGVMIVGSGDFAVSKTIEKYKSRGFKIIAADGGANSLFEAGIVPDYSIGDYDSISKETYEWLKLNQVSMDKYPSKKDKTDMELCIDFAMSMSKEIVITGGSGYRLDHTLANILLLIKFHQKKINIIVEDDYNHIIILSGNNKLDVKEYMGYNLSILPYFDDLIDVTTNGLEYEVLNQRFPFGSSFGVSNVILKENIEINIGEGIGAIIISKDRY